MSTLWIPVILVGLVITAAVLGKSGRRKDIGLESPWPLEAKRTLLTEPEQVLFRRLVQALPHYVVLAQVQLLQAVRFKRGSRNAAVFNRISQLSLDFVVLTPDTRIVAAIELDDASHDDRASADARKAHALKSAEIPLIRWSVREMPDTAKIGLAIANVSSSA
jgi:very-short-patch-repair endonuclease